MQSNQSNQSIRLQKAIFLDRDGVLNKAFIREGKPYPPTSLAELQILPGVKDALGALKENGFLLIVTTNQPDVARGTIQMETVEQINSFLQASLGIDEFRTCYHDTADNCTCRKPKPGLILDAARELGIDLSKSFMVGDRWRDVEAGHAAGVKTVFIDYDYLERRPESFDHKAISLLGALPYLLGAL